MTQSLWFVGAFPAVSFTPINAKAFFGQNMTMAGKAFRSCNAKCKAIDRTTSLSITHLPVTDETNGEFWPVPLILNRESHSADLFTDSGPLFCQELLATGKPLTPLRGENSPMGLIWQQDDLEARTTDSLFLSCDMKVN